jgi:ABC-type transporter Mla subunit MlaD
MSSTRNRPSLKIGSPFKGRPAGKQRSRAFTLSVGGIAIVIACVMFYVGYEAPQSIPFRSYYTLHALFVNADNLGPHYQVKVGGEVAGQVLNPRVVNHQAEVDLQLSSAFKPLLSDSKIQIRLRSAVGVRYVQITPGHNGTPLPDGATFPTSNTFAPVDLDQVLRTFNAPTRVATQNFLGELGQGVAGQGQNINTYLGQLPAFLNNIGSVSAAVNAKPEALKSFISGAQGAAAGFDPVRYDLANGFQPESQALQPFITSAGDFGSTLDQLPPTLTTLNSDLPTVDALVSQVTGLAQAAVPTLGLAPGALDATTALLHHAEPGLRGLNATLKFAHRAIPPTLTFLTTADPVLPEANRALKYGLPIVQQVAPRACGITALSTGWSGMMKWGTDYENFIRFTIHDVTGIATGLTNFPVNPYPGPCVGDYSPVTGAIRQTPEQMVANP